MTTRDGPPSGLVTFVFTDIEGSTRLAQLLGGEYRRVLEEHRRLLRDTFGAHGGVEMFTEGDSFFFAFGRATDAVLSCLAAQRALAAHDWAHPGCRPQVRMGLHSGWAQPHQGEYASPEVHRAARISAAAHGGQVLCSEATTDTATGGQSGTLLAGEAWLRDLGLYRLRGFDGHERLFQLVAPGLEQRFPRLRTEAVSRHNLPATATSFVGRGPEQAGLIELLAEHRLVTLVGAGGTGKTRLAVEVASARVDDYPDGVWFVDLATTTDPGLVAVSVAGTLGFRPEPGRPVLETLAGSAAGRRMLLVLDTCDAQTAAVGQMLARMLSSGDAPRVLATSREPIGLPGEVVWRIPPLSLQPAPDGGIADAVALLMARTVAARGGGVVEPGEVPDLARIATRLDGHPLAIELAAARLRVLGAGQLAERLDAELAAGSADLIETLDAGRPAVGLPATYADRHATLEATVGWSYRTLGPEPATLLRAMAVFARPVDLGTAQWLLGADPFAALTVLVDKSLLHAEPAGGGNGRARTYMYRMLDPIRAYAARALAAAGEEQSARDRHVAWSLEALHRARLGSDGRVVTLSLQRLDPLADEVRAALRWCVSGGTAAAGLHLADSMDQWWRERGLAREARLWLFRLYGRVAETGEPVDPGTLAQAYHTHSLQASADGEYVEQLRYLQRAEEAARQTGDPGLLIRVLAGRGSALRSLGQTDEAEQVSREVIAFAAEQDRAEDALFAVACLARLLWRRGELDEAAALLGAARATEAARPEIRGRRGVDQLLGLVALARGDLVAAHDHLVVALRSRMEHGFHTRACDTICAMAVRCRLGGDLVTAARLFGAAEPARMGMPDNLAGYGGYFAEQRAAVRDALGDAAFDAAYAAGARLSLADAVRVALAVDQETHTELPVS